MFGRLYSVSNWQVPTPFAPEGSPSSKQEKRELTAEQVEKWPEIPKKQFAMRFLAPHLNNTEFAGSHSESSVAYWCHLIDVWLSQEGLCIPFNFNPKLLLELQDVLKGYGKKLDGVKERADATTIAEQIIEQIKGDLQKRGYAYTCLGYRSGPLNGGHSIPLRIDHNPSAKSVTVHFLNLGEGVDMHPEVSWDSHYPRRHFRSYPITFSEQDFFGKKGVELFARQVSLMTESPSAKATPYSAKDVYYPFASLGKPSGHFATELSARSKKPQTTPSCADEAVTLIIRDFLIDKGVDKKEMQRFFCNEKLCAILRFSHTLKPSQEKDDWIMFKKAVQAFAITILKKTSLLPEEVALCKQKIDELNTFVLEGEKGCHTDSVEGLKTVGLENISTLIKPEGDSKAALQALLHDPKIYLKRRIDFPIVNNGAVKPQEFLSWLKRIQKGSALFWEHNLKTRSLYYLADAFSGIEIPRHGKSDYWDLVPKAEIPEILTLFSQLTQGLLKEYSEDYFWKIFDKSCLLLHTFYAISDKLMRRSHAELRGFSPPFIQNLKLIKSAEGTPQFPHLVKGAKNKTWEKIGTYFRAVAAENETTLFAFHDPEQDLNIEQGLKKLTARLNTQDPTASHLKFLAQFLDQNDKGDLPSQYARLWENKDFKWLPQEFHFYQYLALVCWHYSAYGGSFSVTTDQPLCEIIEMAKGGHHVKYKEAVKTYRFQSTFDQLASHRLEDALDTRKAESENRCLCLPQRKIIPGHKPPPPLHLEREWVRLRHHPTLQITSTLQWVLDHLSSVRDERVKDQIEKSLFAPDALLIKNIQESPHLVVRLRHMVKEDITFFGSNAQDLLHLNFFIFLGIAIENNIEEAGFPSDQSLLKEYEHILLQRVAQEHDLSRLYSLYSHLRFLYSVSLPRGDLSLKEMIKASFWMGYTREYDGMPYLLTPRWVIFETFYLEDRYASQLASASANRTWINGMCVEIFQLLFPKMPVPSGEWKGIFPQFTCREFTINVKDCIVLRNQDQLWCFDIFQFRSLRYREGTVPEELKKQFEESQYRIWIGEKAYETYGGGYQCAIVPNSSPPRLNLNKKITTQLGSFWYQQTDVSHPLFKSLTDTGSEIWERAGDHCIAVDAKSGLPLYLLRQMGQGWEVSRLDAQGKILPYKLLNSEAYHPQFFKRLGINPTDALCWVDGEGRLESCHLLPLKLKFQGEKIGSQWVLRCVNYPDFFLSSAQSLSELDSFKGALVLENTLGEKSVLIPVHEFEWHHGNFTTEAKLSTKLLFDSHDGYCLYRLDGVSGLLVNDEPNANLFLALLFASMRNYPRALHYLELGQSFHHCGPLLAKFSLLRDQSPEALAFYLRVSLYFFKNHYQIIQGGYQNKKLSVTSGFTEWMEKNFTGYVRYASLQNSRIPAYIRLTSEEEFLLLSQAEQLVSNYDHPQELPYLLQVRKMLLNSQAINHKIEPHFYTYKLDHDLNTVVGLTSLTNESFKEKGSGAPFNPAFVRMTTEELGKFLPQLYQRAKSGEGELDLYYLAAGYSYEYTVSQYICLLSIVRKFPEPFAHLNFGEDPEENSKVLKEIGKVAARFQDEYTSPSKIAKIYCDYAAHKVLEILPATKLEPVKWGFKANLGKELIEFHQSLNQNFLLDWVTVETEPYIKDSRLFIFDKLPPQMQASPILKGILETFQKGYLECLEKKNGRDVFTLKKNKQWGPLTQAVETLLKEKKGALEILKKKAERIANTVPPNLFQIGLRKAGADLPPIAFEGILTEALEAENGTLIRAANPSLSEETIHELLVMTMRCHILNCHINQLGKGMKALQKGDLQKFGEEVAVYGAFDPTEDPGLLIFQSKTKMAARKEQAAFIEWLKKVDVAHCKTLLFEFEAGGGKGTFFTPLLNKLAKKLGLFPVSISPASLYQVERKKQRASLKRAYNLNLEVLELTLNTEATDKDFKWIYEKLLDYREDALKIIPEVYYALDLKYQLALESRNVEQVRYLSLILNLFEEKSAGLIDEGRVNLSPFTQAKIGIGKKLSLSPSTHKLFIHLYQALTDPKYTLPNGQKVCDVIQLTQNKQAMMSKEESAAVRTFLIQHLAAHSYLQIPKEKQKAMIAWWSNQNTPKPKWLLKEEKNQTDVARLCLEAGEYFHQYYDFATTTVGRMRHVPSLQAGEEIDVPARRRKATKAYFEEPYISLILTIQGMLQRGLSKEQCKKLITLLQEAREVESVTTHTPDIEAHCAKWMPTLSLVHLNAQDPADVEKVYKALHKNTEAIFWYLEKAVLPQVTYSTEQLNVTPQHFLHAFKTSIVYSAFLGPTEAYGVNHSEQHVKQNRAFAAQVVHELTAGLNLQMDKLPPFTTPLEFLEYLWKIRPDLFKDLSMLIDVGGMLRDFSSEEVAAAFFEFMKKHPEVKYDGCILFQDSLNKEEESDMMVWLKGEEKPVIIPEGDVISGLEALGYKWEDLKLLTIIDPSHATGSDIVQPKGATAYMMLGENLTVGDLIQGVMRLRGFLDKQKVVWGVLKTLADRIAEIFSMCTPETALFWALANEAVTQQKEIILSAYQQIDYLVQKPARADLKGHLHQPEKQIELWHTKYRKGFVKPFNNDPLSRFGQEEMSDDADKILLDYAAHEYAAFGYQTAESACTKGVARVAQAIKSKIPKLSCRQELGKETQLYCHQDLKKEQEKIGYTDLTADDLPPLKESIHLYQPGLVKFMTSDKFSVPARQLFNSEGLSDNLFFSHKYIHTAKTAGESLKETYLKPAYYFLIIYEEKELRAFVLSDEEAAYFQQQLIEPQNKGSVGRQVALFTADGVLAKNGPQQLALSQEQFKTLLTLPWFAEIVTDIGLISCTLRNMASFVKRAEKWGGLQELWNRLKTYQPQSELLNLSPIDRCIASAAKKKKKSFF